MKLFANIIANISVPIIFIIVLTWLAIVCQWHVRVLGLGEEKAKSSVCSYHVTLVYSKLTTCKIDKVLNRSLLNHSRIAADCSLDRHLACVTLVTVYYRKHGYSFTKSSHWR